MLLLLLLLLRAQGKGIGKGYSEPLPLEQQWYRGHTALATLAISAGNDTSDSSGFSLEDAMSPLHTNPDAPCNNHRHA